ncbi:MAG: hypothetical protein MJZ97_00300 [Bacteroidales bacterium]|nr:hypothetical protein [Bacteroidales bacterium]
MPRGKQTCKILKEIRKQIAAENDIELVVSECTYQGDCLGTCPKCEAEVRYLERELEKRQRLGKAVAIQIGSNSEFSSEDLMDKVSATTIRGQVADYYIDYSTYLERFLQVKKHRNLQCMVDTTGYSSFFPPYFWGGEIEMQSFVSENLASVKGLQSFSGDMEVAFVVETDGRLSHVRVEKGLEDFLDKNVAAIFRLMPEWVPAKVVLDDGTEKEIPCECVQKLHFPLINQ